MSLSQTAYEKILEFVVSGKYRPGSILKEEELASLLNISRTPIREALVRLEKEGIIIKNGKSYSVIPLSETDIIQLYEVRIPLEAEASRLASIRATQEEINNMLRLIDQIKNTKESDPLKLANLNGNLHSLIAEASHNKYIVDVLNNIRLKLKIVRVTLFTSYQRRDEELKEHEEIILAIRDRKGELAYEMMKKHEENVLNYVKLNVLPLLFR